MIAAHGNDISGGSLGGRGMAQWTLVGALFDHGSLCGAQAIICGAVAHGSHLLAYGSKKRKGSAVVLVCVGIF